MPVLEKCFEPFSDEEAFANLSKNIFGERRENKPQTTFWPGTDAGFRRSDMCLLAAARHARRSQNVLELAWASAGPLVFLTQGGGDSPGK